MRTPSIPGSAMPCFHIGLYALIGGSLLWTSIASGQVMPVLDPKIPTYQHVGVMNGAITVAGSIP